MKIMFPDNELYHKPETDLTVYEGKYRDFLTEHEGRLTTDTWYDCQLALLTTEPNGKCKSILVDIKPTNAKTFRLRLRILIDEEFIPGFVKFDEYENLPWSELSCLIRDVQSGVKDNTPDLKYRILSCVMKNDDSEETDVQAI